jgi:hypothetical protein
LGTPIFLRRPAREKKERMTFGDIRVILSSLKEPKANVPTDRGDRGVYR